MDNYIKRADAMRICERYSQHCFETNDSRGQDIADRILDDIVEMSTADVEEVVRCVKCGFRDDNLVTTSQNIDCYMCKRHHSLVLLNDFCSYGERK